MADRTYSRTNLSVTTPHPISKDVLGSDNPIPLSPQWLLPKSVESRTDPGPGEKHLNSYPNSGGILENKKSSGNYEEKLDTQKKDVFRPSSLDMERSVRRDRWRDEERDTNSLIRKDRWREGDKEFGDTRKIERWTENSSTRQPGESRRAPTERWNDSTNRENNLEQHRESKWNSRWGPDAKDKEGTQEKWADSGKEGDIPFDKGTPNLISTAKDEKDGDAFRPWRSNSSQSRGRGEPSYNQNLTPNKQGPSFSYGRGRGDNTPPTFSVGRGRVSSSGNSANNFSTHSQPLGMVSEKGESYHGEHSFLKYSRTKLLDVYRTIDINSSWKKLDGSVQAPALTQEDSIEPLALSAPNPEEAVILKGIDNGDIVSSGAPQVSKEGSVGRNAADFVHSRRPKLGSKEDLAFNADDGEADGADISKASQSNLKIDIMQDYHMHPDNQFNHEVGRDNRSAYGDEVPAKKDSSMHGNSSVIVGATRTALSFGQPQKDPNAWQGSFANSPHSKNESKWQGSEDSGNKRLPPGISNREHESSKIVPPSPEDMVLYYKDPQGELQGPFSGIDIMGWFEAGYFGIDLKVRLATAPKHAPFSSLGDVMPHLRAKARPPPGFSSSKPNDITDASTRPSFGSFGKIHGGSSEIDFVKNELRHLHGSGTEAENKFVESLMSGNLNSSSLEKLGFSEGLQGYIGNNSSGGTPMGVESGNALYLLAKKMEFERQKSLPSPYPFWPGRDAPSMVQMPEIIPVSPALPLNPNNLRQQSQSQSTDLIGALQGLSDRASSGIHNNNVTNWSHFPVQDHGQNAAFGIQQQRIQAQNPPSLTNLLAQTIDNSSTLPQDPQILSLLQQQYLLQLNSQAQAPAPIQQLSLLDKLLLLKQQQKQEQEQQAMRQQQMLSQVLSEHQPLQGFGEPLYGQPGTSIQATAVSVPSSNELFQISSSMPVAYTQNDHKLPPQNFEATSLHLPHQMFGNVSSSQKSWGNALPGQTNVNQHKEGLPLSAMNDVSHSSEVVMDRSSEDFPIFPELGRTSNYTSTAPRETKEKKSRINEALTVGGSKVTSEFVTTKLPVTLDSIPSSGTEENLLKSGIGNMQINLDGSFEEHARRSRSTDEPPSKAIENVEVEVRKISDKKSRKQKASKSHSSSDQAKEVSKTVLHHTKQYEIEQTNVCDIEFDAHTSTREPFYETYPQIVTDCNFGINGDDETKAFENISVPSKDQPGQRAWKPAPGFKAKSLLEIQLEEQRRAQAEPVVSEIKPSSYPIKQSAPWAEVVANGDTWAEDVFAKSIEKNMEISDTTFSIPSQPVADTHLDSFDNDNFIEAKDTKKNRKKSAKAKSGAKVSTSVTSADQSFVGASSVDNGKSTRHVQQDKEVLPVIPSGPSLGDFVLWKGENVNAATVAPAWSSESGKGPKPTSLRDILKEQQKKGSSVQNQSQMSAPSLKPQPLQGTRGSVALRSVPTAPIQINSHAASAHSKSKGDDDLFWGAIDQPKEANRVDFPQLASQGTRNTPVKGNPGGSSGRQKSTSGKQAERSLSSSPATGQIYSKGKKDVITNKHSEATDFRDWCVSESLRLIGTKDTSFLEFCLKQSRTEAETLLTENIGSFDPGHQFIDKFLNYKELIPTDVLELAFQIQNDRKIPNVGAGDMISDNAGFANMDGFTKGGGKKKGKKGKKINPSVLGFNVVSNRIMMGEIQTLEE